MTGGGSLSLANLALPVRALATAQAGLSGAGSRLVLEAVTVVEHPEWGALTGTTMKANGELEYDGLNSLANLPRFTVLSGPCTTALVDGHWCVGRWPGGYGPNEDCTIAVAGGGGGGGGGAGGGVLGGCPVFDIDSGEYLGLPWPDSDGLHREEFANFDYCPAGHRLAAGQRLAWHSDGSWQGDDGDQPVGNGLPQSHHGLGGGWQVCFACAASQATLDPRAHIYKCL
eukprot:SAG22_NODE_503_length_9694_cov_13.573736_1_plen_228_part_00